MRKYYYEGPTFKLWRGSRGPSFKFWTGCCGPTFKLWGASQGLEVSGPRFRSVGPTFTPCRENLCRQIDYIKRLLCREHVHVIFSIKTVVWISYKNIFIKTLLIETLNQNIKTCLQKQQKKLRNVLEQEMALLLKLHISRSFSAWGAQLCCCSWRTCPEKSGQQWSFYSYPKNIWPKT